MSVLLGILLEMVEIVLIPIKVCPVLLQSTFLREIDWEKGGIVSEVASAYIII